MSWQTAQAKAALDRQAQRWQQHRQNCPDCSRQHYCAAGWDIFHAWGHAQAEYNEQRLQDAQPITGQAALW